MDRSGVFDIWHAWLSALGIASGEAIPVVGYLVHDLGAFTALFTLECFFGDIIWCMQLTANNPAISVRPPHKLRRVPSPNNHN